LTLDEERDEIPELGDAITQLIGLLIDSPDDLEVSEEIERSGDTTFRVRVVSDDLGKVIGRQGRTARSLRAFLEVRGALDDRRYDLEIR
jgi:uncharacterized protein